jgi:type IV pilus assembly protein PilC
MKKAKDFSLKEATNRNTFKIDGINNSSEPQSSSSDEIFLEIVDDQEVSAALTKAKKASSTQNFFQNKLGLDINKLFKRGIPIKDKSIFYELISTMLTAGISIIQAIKIFSDQTTNKYFKQVTQEIAQKLETGKSFSEALSEYSHIFSESEIGMVSSGEVTGKLNEVLKRLSKELEEGVELRAKIRSALIYPVIVFVFVILTVYAMLRFVIPQIKELFATTGLDLPAITEFLITVSDIVINNSFVAGITILVGFLIVIVTYSNPKTRFYYHQMFLKVPVLKDFLLYINQAKFSRNLSNLLNAGVSVIDSLVITSKGLSNLVYRQRVYLTSKDVAQGITISESLQDSPLFSGLTINMIAIGERTAQIDDLASKVSKYYDMKTKEMAENFSKLIQPFIILFVGTLVGVVVLAIMLPMTELLSGIDSI